MNGEEAKLNDCGCCEGIHAQTPTIKNPPGLTALAYRVGTHSRFKQSLHAGLTGPGKLRPLKTRRDEDPTIGLIDAWATVLDVLAFYQERIANEGYLRTATERRSLLELARAIGYELRPGVAAGTYLAFTLETPPPGPPTTGSVQPSSIAGVPRQVTIEIGAKAQSVPEPGEKAQTFETVEDIIARPDWNRLRPQQTQLQRVLIDGQTLRYAETKAEVRALYFAGTSTGLAPGDLLLVTGGSGSATKTLTRRVLRVKTDDELKRTEVEIEPGGEGQLPEARPPTDFVAPNLSSTAPPLPFTEDNLKTNVLNLRLRERDLQAVLQRTGWNAEDLIEFANQWRVRTILPVEQAILAFRERTGFFGHNAPVYASLRDKDGDPLFQPNWDQDGWPIWEAYPVQSASTATGGFGLTSFVETRSLVFGGRSAVVGKAMALKDDPALERNVAGIVKNSWAVFVSANTRQVYRVTEARESSAVGFGMSGRVTTLKLLNPDNSTATRPAEFLVRTTTAYVKSEPLELAGLPVPDVIAKDATVLTLDRMVLGLRPGQLVILSGEQHDPPGAKSSELLELQEIIHHHGLTTLLFREKGLGKGLRNSYVRSKVTLNANVAPATQGETKREVLGSGDAAQAFQQFVPKQSPLTYVSAPTPTGLTSTLELRVNDVQWDESPGLYGVPPSERTFITRRSDDGKTIVQFGDGVTGGRLPSGVENVTAKYRVGLGLEGNVKAGQISLLLTRPLGVKEVVNPLPVTGAADPETRDQARENAPFTVLTLDRIVTLQDFEDYARAYPGIGKAQAVWLWYGESKVIHLTIAGADGGPVATTSDLYRNLRLSIEAARDPGQRVRLDSFVPLTFNVQAKLLITRGYLTNKVKAAVTATVQTEFSFPRRAFGQAVTRSEVLATIQDVEGVEAVDLDAFHFNSDPPALASRLPARAAEWNNAHSAIRAAELLLVNPREIQLAEMPK